MARDTSMHKKCSRETDGEVSLSESHCKVFSECSFYRWRRFPQQQEVGKENWGWSLEWWSPSPDGTIMGTMITRGRDQDLKLGRFFSSWAQPSTLTILSIFVACDKKKLQCSHLKYLAVGYSKDGRSEEAADHVPHSQISKTKQEVRGSILECVLCIKYVSVSKVSRKGWTNPLAEIPKSHCQSLWKMLLGGPLVKQYVWATMFLESSSSSSYFS